MLERLSNLGMRLAEEIAERAAQVPRAADPTEPAPEPRHDPGRAFAAVSRAVRFSLALEAKIDQQILALRRGDAAAAPGVDPDPDDTLPWDLELQSNSFEKRRNRISACLWDAIDEGMTDPVAADDLCFAVQERLMEGEVYDEHLFRPLRESVEAICKDLGLKPDWSRWDDEAGFPPETRRTDHDFTSIWAKWPSGAKGRREYRVEEDQIAAIRAGAARQPGLGGGAPRGPPRPDRRE
jgi:hypothetical protein